MIYLLDSNACIEAKNRYYRFNVCPGFWEWRSYQTINIGQLQSIERVLEELQDQKDALTEWATSNNHFFEPNDDDVTQQYFAQIVNFVSEHETYKQHEKDRFLDKADPWIVAKALTLNAVVVTHEEWVPPNSTKVKIPNICQKFGVRYCDTFDVLEESDARFVLE